MHRASGQRPQPNPSVHACAVETGVIVGIQVGVAQGASPDGDFEGRAEGSAAAFEFVEEGGGEQVGVSCRSLADGPFAFALGVGVLADGNEGEGAVFGVALLPVAEGGKEFLWGFHTLEGFGPISARKLLNSEASVKMVIFAYHMVVRNYHVIS